MADLFKIVQAQKFSVAASGISIGATSIVLNSFKQIDGTTNLTMTDFGSTGYGTLSPNTSREEQISFTGVTQNANGTATLTGVKTVLNVDPYTETSGTINSQAGNAVFVISNTAGFYSKFANKLNDETITGTYNFTVLPTSDGGNAISGTELITYAQALALATGTANINRIVVAGTAGETLVAGNLVYLKIADGRWWKCDADTAATVDNIIMGIAQGAGTAGNLITSGVLLFGLDSNQTGLTTNTAYYASNTAGAISSSVGTVEVSVGISQSTTSIIFYPRYNQQLTEDQQDALAGDSGTPSGTNPFVTAKGLQLQAENYAASTTGNDTYVVTLSPAPTSYTNGMVIRFKPDTANTGAATLNVNGLGAISIVKNLATALDTGDIVANQIVEVVYNSTGPVFQLISILPSTFPSISSTSGTGAPTSTSTTQTVTHGLGRIPQTITIYGFGQGNGATNNYGTSFGTYNSSGNKCINQRASSPPTSTSSYAVFVERVTASFEQATGVIQNVTSTTFDIVWTVTADLSTITTYLWTTQ